MNFAKLTIAVAAFAVSGVAVAAQDGTPGPTSTGSSVVTIIKQDAAQITKVNDLNFNNPGFLSNDVRLADDVCVFSTTGAYNVTLTSTNGTNDFLLRNGSGDDMPYSVAWGAATTLGAVGSGTAITGGTALAGQAGNGTDLDCAGDAGGVNAAFAVEIAAADYNAAPVGTYTDILTILVAPE